MSETSAARNQHSDFAGGTLGERVGDDSLCFERFLRAPIERVWDALTTPRGLAVWLGRPIDLDLVVGGAFEIDLTDEDRMNGRIVELQPQRRLVIAWHETSNGASSPYGTLAGDESLVTFDLSPGETGGTRLVFTHRYIRGGEIMAGFGAGWHAILEALGALLEGSPGVDREARYLELKPWYDEHLAVGNGSS